jgi:hypothetical protein
MGPSGKNPSTADSSQVNPSMYSSRGFGELGSTKKGPGDKVGDIKKELDDLERDDLSDEEEDEKKEMMTCPNCKEQHSVHEAAAHTV